MGNGVSDQTTAGDGPAAVASTSSAAPIAPSLDGGVGGGGGGARRKPTGYSKPEARCAARDMSAFTTAPVSTTAADESTHLREALAKKDAQLQQLRDELDRMRAVLQRTAVSGGRPDILATVQDDSRAASSRELQKKIGVSGESVQSDVGIQLTYYEKDFRSMQLIKDALTKNDFLKNLDATQVREIVNCMYEKSYAQGDYVIREGDAGQHLFVSADGSLEVLKEGKVVGKLYCGHAFGELAILYNCKRTASVKAMEPCKVWALDRKVFQSIMMRTGLERQKEKISFLKSVQLLRDLPNDKLSKIADVLEVDFFEDGEYIIREGQNGDTFYIISKGEVLVTQKIQGKRDPQLVRTLHRGEFFGEKALLHEERRTANVIATAPGVECLTLNRDPFIRLIGDLSEFHEKDYGDESRGAERLYREPFRESSNSTNLLQPDHEPLSRTGSVSLHRKSLHESVELESIQLRDLEVVSTLGVGGFGRVELVRVTSDSSRTYALKCLKKQHIVDTNQQEHVYSEKCILSNCRSPFIVRLYKTFKDSKYVYFLMEVCLGGELWSILRDRGHFDDTTARFCVGCVVAALQYLHSRGIAFRDLKPENLLLTKSGYLKLVDFGFAKQIGMSRKTWTFCGTPEYVAPEVILNKGHDLSVDFWALGILTYELCTGVPPFAASDPMKTYNLIIRGIDALTFSKKISKNAQSLVKKLCADNPSERLGCQKNGYADIKKHKWFQGFDWDGLYRQEMVPPLQPKVLGPDDNSNFDQYAADDGIPPDEFSGWDDDF